MELRHLQYFVTVSTTGGFGRAARVLHVSQSAISEQIRDLETELGALLIDRSQRQIRLTAEGTIFLEGARATLQAAEQSIQAVRRSLQGEVGKLTIGFFVGGSGSYFPALIRAFRSQCPDVQVSLVEMLPSLQLTALVNGTLDIAFTRPLPTIYHGQLRSERFHTERLFAVLPKHHRLAKLHELAVEALQGEPFVMSDRQSSPTTFDKIITLCAEAGFSPQIASTASVSTGAIALVEAGEGITIVAEGFRFLASEEVVFIPITGQSASVDLMMAWSVGNISEVHRSFLSAARKFRDELYVRPTNS